MLYFSEMYGKKVFAQQDRYLGKLCDLYFLSIETPIVTKFVIKTPEKETLLLPAKHIEKKGIDFHLTDYEKEEKKMDEVSLMKKLQNQQVIDIAGEKIIRVNDVVISDVPVYTISGIDVGVLGVFRWIGPAMFLAKVLREFSIHFKSDFISWDDIEAGEVAYGRIVLKEQKERLHRVHPEDLAERLEHATIRNVLRSLKVMDIQMSAQVIADLNVDYQREIFQRFPPQHAGKVLSLIDPDEAVDVLLSLGHKERDEIFQYIERGRKQPILHLLRHANTPIGHLMTTEYLEVPAGFTIKMARQKLTHDTGDFSELLYIYAINKERQIVGVLNLHELLVHDPALPLYKVMNQDLILARLTTPKEIVMRRMIKYHIYAIPVVDENRKILGVVSLQRISESMLEKE